MKICAVGAGVTFSILLARIEHSHNSYRLENIHWIFSIGKKARTQCNKHAELFFLLEKKKTLASPQISSKTFFVLLKAGEECDEKKKLYRSGTIAITEYSILFNRETFLESNYLIHKVKNVSHSTRTCIQYIIACMGRDFGYLTFSVFLCIQKMEMCNKLQEPHAIFRCGEFKEPTCTEWINCKK